MGKFRFSVDVKPEDVNFLEMESLFPCIMKNYKNQAKGTETISLTSTSIPSAFYFELQATVDEFT